MNSDPNYRLRQRQQEEAASGTAQEQQAETAQGREFSSVEELLRHDAQGHPVPPEVAHRLNQSLAAEPRPAKSWLKRLFG